MLEGRIRALPQEYTSRVHILGARSGMPAVLSDLDCVLCTSRNEGLPVALIEAAAAGKPVVASAVGGVAELVAHERTGYLGQGTDELAYGLDQLLESPAACADMGRRARLRVAERHGARALADRLEAIYAAALAESGGKQPRLA
jgi:glycosyltransferase involved in cell wall biosynthesis